jgi:hypothetical protein
MGERCCCLTTTSLSHASPPVYTALLLAIARCALSSHQEPALAPRMVSSLTEDRLISADLQVDGIGDSRAAATERFVRC